LAAAFHAMSLNSVIRFIKRTRHADQEPATASFHALDVLKRNQDQL
jgi:hypothetical protein